MVFWRVGEKYATAVPQGPKLFHAGPAALNAEGARPPSQLWGKAWLHAAIFSPAGCFFDMAQKFGRGGCSTFPLSMVVTEVSRTMDL